MSEGMVLFDALAKAMNLLATDWLNETSTNVKPDFLELDTLAFNAGMAI